MSNEMYLGFPELDENGNVVGINKDLTCLDPTCRKLKWDEEAIKEKRLRHPFVAKNTILIPSMGYVIVRVIANNPGIFMYIITY